MYSKGMGYEPSEEGLGRKDTGETYRVRMGSKDIPAGIQTAMIGMKKGEKRRVELPSSVGFETSDWAPAPVSTPTPLERLDFQIPIL